MQVNENFKFINHSACEYFPCHKTDKPEEFNCLFCYCPLYALGEDCGGNFKYTENGNKDCSECMIPHGKEGYDYINQRFHKIVEMVKKNENREE